MYFVFAHMTSASIRTALGLQVYQVCWSGWYSVVCNFLFNNMFFTWNFISLVLKQQKMILAVLLLNPPFQWHESYSKRRFRIKPSSSVQTYELEIEPTWEFVELLAKRNPDQDKAVTEDEGINERTFTMLVSPQTPPPTTTSLSLQLNTAHLLMLLLRWTIYDILSPPNLLAFSFGN